MASITITVPDSVLTRVTTALCVHAGKPVNSANAKAEIIEMIKRVVKVYESQQAAQTAQTSASADVDANIILS